MKVARCCCSSLLRKEKMKQLQVLKDLFESGALTKEEYNIAKKKVMNE